VVVGRSGYDTHDAPAPLAPASAGRLPRAPRPTSLLARLGRLLLIALVLDLLSWPPLLAGAVLASLVVGPGGAGGTVPDHYWPALLAGQYACWVLLVLVVDAVTAPRRPARARSRLR
jgi:hypothetical protein